MYARQNAFLFAWMFVCVFLLANQIVCVSASLIQFHFLSFSVIVFGGQNERVRAYDIL